MSSLSSRCVLAQNRPKIMATTSAVLSSSASPHHIPKYSTKKKISLRNNINTNNNINHNNKIITSRRVVVQAVSSSNNNNNNSNNNDVSKLRKYSTNNGTANRVGVAASSLLLTTISMSAGLGLIDLNTYTNNNTNLIINTNSTKNNNSNSIFHSPLSSSRNVAYADEESRRKAKALLEEISANAGSSSIKPVNVAKKTEGKKVRALITEDVPKPEKKKKRFKSEVLKEEKSKASTAPVVAAEKKEINVAAIATIFASLAALGGGGFLLTKLDLKIDVGSIGGLGNVIQFLDENMAKDVLELGVGGETVIKTDDFKSGKGTKGKTVRKKK